MILGSDVVIEEHVFFLGENCIVGFEPVFVEKLLVSAVGWVN